AGPGRHPRLPLLGPHRPGGRQDHLLPDRPHPAHPDDLPLNRCWPHRAGSARLESPARPHLRAAEPATTTISEVRVMPRFTLNGKDVSVDVPADTPLLWVLRDSLHLTGTKFGCGVGQCGACTVHIDGVAQKSCQFPVSSVEGKTILTIEGLSPDGKHRVQEAWIAEQVPQC